MTGSFDGGGVAGVRGRRDEWARLGERRESGASLGGGGRWVVANHLASLARCINTPGRDYDSAQSREVPLAKRTDAQRSAATWLSPARGRVDPVQSVIRQ